MRLLDLVVFYLLLGAGACALVARRGRRSPADLALAWLLWPLIVPVTLGGGEPEAPRHEAHPEYGALVAALGAVRDPQLQALLPTEEQLRPLAAHLALLDQKLAELDTVLARDEFADDAEPELAASHRRLAALRASSACERDELIGLCRRLRAQITVLRFSGASAGDVRSLVAELLGRVEGAQAAMDV